MPERILVADDDREIVDIIRDSLTDEGYLVSDAYDGEEVLEKLRSSKIDLVILDIMMPRLDGLEALKLIKKTSNVPVIMLSARGRDIDKVVGLQMGADDYLSKPFSMDELVARVSAHLRRERKKEKADDILRLGNIEIRKSTFQVKVGRDQIDVSTKEFLILCYLMENKGRVLTRDQIYSHVWNDAFGGDPNTVTVHIKNLRSKLGADSALIKTIWGIGYRMEGEG